MKGLGSIDKRMPLFKNICNNFEMYSKPISFDGESWKKLLESLFNTKSTNRKFLITNYEPKIIDHTL